MAWNRAVRPALALIVGVMALGGAATAQSEAPEFAFSREVTVFVSSPPVLVAEAPSREAVVYLSEPAVVLARSDSREAIVFNSESPIVDAFSREVSVFDGYYLADALLAARVAGGVAVSTPTFFERLQMAMRLTGQSRINMPVAVEVLRIAVSLTP